MGNVSTKDIGNTQQKIGQVGASINVVMSTIFGSIFILLGIGAIIMAFIPTSFDTETNLPCTNDKDCVNDDTCNNNTKKCTTHGKKTKHYWLILLGISFILGAVFIIWFSHWWKSYTKTNRTAAQIGAVGMEVGWLQDIFQH
jgi:hypothetical protein